MTLKEQCLEYAANEEKILELEKEKLVLEQRIQDLKHNCQVLVKELGRHVGRNVPEKLINIGNNRVVQIRSEDTGIRVKIITITEE